MWVRNPQSPFFKFKIFSLKKNKNRISKNLEWHDKIFIRSDSWPPKAKVVGSNPTVTTFFNSRFFHKRRKRIRFK